VIRVLVVDDHSVVRRGLIELFGTAVDIDVVGDAADGAAAIEAAERLRPDLVLMDLSMPGIDGVEATRRIRAAHPEVAVVILTSFSEQPRILGAIDAGAVGYPLGAQRQVAADLSDREREVLACVVEGLPNKLIARRLAISEKTVKAHLTSVFRRIGVNDRTQAALWADRHGITPSA